MVRRTWTQMSPLLVGELAPDLYYTLTLQRK